MQDLSKLCCLVLLPQQQWAAQAQLAQLVAWWWNLPQLPAPVGALVRMCVPWKQLPELPGLEVAACLYREVSKVPWRCALAMCPGDGRPCAPCDPFACAGCLAPHACMHGNPAMHGSGNAI